MRKDQLHDREVTPAPSQDAADARPVRTMRLPGTAGGATLHASEAGDRRPGTTGAADPAITPGRTPTAP